MGNCISCAKAGFPLIASAGSNEIDKKKNYIDQIPEILDTEIYSYLELSDVVSVCFVSKRANKAISDTIGKTPSLKERLVYRDYAFNSKDWKTYFGKDVDTKGEESSFPPNIWKELNKPCPVFPRKRMGQTHTFTWVPKMIGRERLTVRDMGKLLNKRFPSSAQHYGYNHMSLMPNEERKGVAKSSWVVMTKDVIPRSRKKSYEVQERLVANLDKKTPYEVPMTLEAVVCISTNYFKSGKRLFNDNPKTYTRCQERTQGYRIIVGDFGDTGLSIRYDGVNKARYGIAAQRRIGPS